MNLNWNWGLILTGALLVLVEVAFGGFAGFDLVLIGSSFLAGGTLGLAFRSAPLGFIVASILCLAYIGVGRRWMRRTLHPRHQPSNVDAVIGQEGIVLSRVAPHAAGQVRVRDEVWRALPASTTAAFEPGTIVTVQDVDGVTLHVR